MEPLKGFLIQKTAKSNPKRQETDLQIVEILNILYTLSATVEKQNQEICKLKKLVKNLL